MSTIQRKKRRPNGGAGKGLQSQKIIKSAESFVKSLAMFDLNITKTCSLCANQRSPLANLRPLMKLLEISCHGVPWILGTVLLLVSLHKENHIEILVNLFIGCMPLLPPARRSWTEKQITLVLHGCSLNWPPTNWKTLSPDRKLLTWEYAAMRLENALNPEEVNITSSRGDLLDKYNMLALPGTAFPIMNTACRKARFYNYELLRLAANSKNPSKEQINIVEITNRRFDSCSIAESHSTEAKTT
ncbi:hypothetical protein KUTeg_021960 [Tegillarca granosa]|uniref:Uncharacterized protein n=1 Tax=Tegillarca granosa TaxID=220873 RepID=A0ABQ9E4U6_TEGGR|nr:hypothetical protein KUTeg_021960 [Tegillarca granosa]